MANVFYYHHERKRFEEYSVVYAASFYKRYVDAIVVLLKSENHVNNLLFYFNSKHPNIRFTCEIEKNWSLLDISVYWGNNKFETSVHRKSTFCGANTKKRAFFATEYKSSLITALLYGSFTIVFDYHKLHEEIVKLKLVLRKKGYLTWFLDKVISKFLEKKIKETGHHYHSS